jgi:hypothetical protein
MLSFDLGAITAILCLVQLSFYASLLCTTLLFVAALGTIFLVHCLLQKRHQHSLVHLPSHLESIAKASQIRQSCIFVAIYFLTFVYPIVSVKVVEVFGCHVVEGVAYLRADYAIECYTNQWTAMAVYASVFLVGYVVGFPVFIGLTLWSYRHQLRAQSQGPGRVCKLAPTGLLLGFLLDDYQLRLPSYMW